MSLARFFSTIAPLLHGQAPLGEVASRLYGDGWQGCQDARRLSIYARFCAVHRDEALLVYAHLREAVVRHHGEAAWARLRDDYFAAHPMRSFELNENGAALPGFLEGHAQAAALSPWLVGLADFEWWEWQTAIAADDPGAPAGPRLHSSVELRRYDHDYVRWIDEVDEDGRSARERGEAPPRTETLVLFWRDPDLIAQREPASPLELLVMQGVMGGCADPALLSGASGAAAGDIEATMADLRAAGIVV